MTGGEALGWMLATLLIGAISGVVVGRAGMVKKGECIERHKNMDTKFKSGEKEFTELKTTLEDLRKAVGNVQVDIGVLLADRGLQRRSIDLSRIKEDDK